SPSSMSVGNRSHSERRRSISSTCSGVRRWRSRSQETQPAARQAMMTAPVPAHATRTWTGRKSNRLIEMTSSWQGSHEARACRAPAATRHTPHEHPALRRPARRRDGRAPRRRSWPSRTPLAVVRAAVIRQAGDPLNPLVRSVRPLGGVRVWVPPLPGLNLPLGLLILRDPAVSPLPHLADLPVDQPAHPLDHLLAVGERGGLVLRCHTVLQRCFRFVDDLVRVAGLQRADHALVLAWSGLPAPAAPLDRDDIGHGASHEWTRNPRRYAQAGCLS